MELLLRRRWLTPASSIGDLFVDGLWFCFSLEDATRPLGEKVFGQTAIPLGRYEVRITKSPRFGVEMPLLLDVPGYEGVRIHPGNKPADTLGCILVGRQRAPDRIIDSKLAYDDLFALIAASLEHGEPVHITVVVEVSPR